jgi:hypothetical protein
MLNTRLACSVFFSENSIFNLGIRRGARPIGTCSLPRAGVDGKTNAELRGTVYGVGKDAVDLHV